MEHKKQFFDEVLEKFVKRDGRTARKISEASEDESLQVPHTTISRWLRGLVKKPRAWQDLVKLAIALRLTEAEADELLMSAKHPTIAALRESVGHESDKELLNKVLMVRSAEPPFQVPSELRYFIGREAQVSGLREVLLSETGSLVCLQGMGGVGKTSLAIRMAYQLREHFPDGVLWSQLDKSDTMSVLRAFADSYGCDVSQYTSLGCRSSKVRELLAHKQALIVLDDAESDEQVRPLLPPTGLCAVIITTRRHDLSVANDARHFKIEPFSKQKEAALALFAKILGSWQAQRERYALSEIADLLGHLPLAIAIAGNRMRHELGWSATHFLARVREQERRLKELARGDQCIRLSFDLSYHALPAHLQHFFATLSVFEGEDFSVEATAYVAELSIWDTEDYLGELYSFSLVQEGRNGRYKLHPLLRDYSRELAPPDCETAKGRNGETAKRQRLSPTRSLAHLPPELGGTEGGRERMATFFVDYVEAQQRDYDTLDLEIDHLFAALEVASRHDMKATLVRGAIAFYPYLQARGLYQQAKLHSERAQQAARELDDQVGLASLLRNLGRIANKQGYYCQAKEYYDQALTLARQAENDEQISALLTSLGALCYRRGNFAQAKEHYDEAMSLAKEAQNMFRIAALLTNLGLIEAELGHYNEAQSYYQEALQLSLKDCKKKSLCITLLQNLGKLMHERGNYAQARSYIEDGLALARSVGDPELRSRLLGNLGLVAYALGNHSEAAAHFRKGLSLAEASGLTLQISRQRANLAKVETKRGNYEQANLHYQAALEQARQNAFPADICIILNQWGNSYQAQKKKNQALTAFREALQTARQANLQQEIAKSLEGLARLAAKRGNIEQAHQFGQESQQLFEAIGHKRANEILWWLKELPGMVG